MANRLKQDDNVRDSDVDVRYPDVDVRYPDVDVRYPDVDVRYPDIDVRDPDVDVRYPDVDVRYPDVDVRDPDVDVRYPDISVVLQKYMCERYYRIIPQVLLTWIISVSTGVVSTMLAETATSPAIIHSHCIFHRAVGERIRYHIVLQIRSLTVYTIYVYSAFLTSI